MIYKPFINLIVNLLSTSTFVNIINYKYIKYNNNDNADILDGISARKNKSIMEFNFNEVITSNNNAPDCVQINLLCAIFYDGLQIYKSHTSTFWPLYITILNLPPSFRSTNHSGIFLSSIFTSKSFLF
jgi:hypothetical protein